jgi:hypothetical protein
MKISTVILATTMAIISSCAFAAEGDAPGNVSGTAATSSGAKSAAPGTTGKPGDFSETGGQSNRGTSGDNPVGQVAPGTSNAPAGNAATK